MQLENANEVIWYGKPVLYDGIEYTLTAVIKRKHHKENKWHYQAELTDIKAARSVVIVPLEKVVEK